jgi:hypothetical protein
MSLEKQGSRQSFTPETQRTDGFQKRTALEPLGWIMTAMAGWIF